MLLRPVYQPRLYERFRACVCVCMALVTARTPTTPTISYPNKAHQLLRGRTRFKAHGHVNTAHEHRSYLPDPLRSRGIDHPSRPAAPRSSNGLDEPTYLDSLHFPALFPSREGEALAQPVPDNSSGLRDPDPPFRLGESARNNPAPRCANSDSLSVAPSGERERGAGTARTPETRANIPSRLPCVLPASSTPQREVLTRIPTQREARCRPGSSIESPPS
jgi:hypothetical protein